MKKALLIAEKPSLMKDIREAYQTKGHEDQIDFTAFAGHTMGLAMPPFYSKEWEVRKVENLPMIPSPFVYLPTESKKKMYGDIKAMVLSGKYDYIINACDPAREGQHIFWSFFDSLNSKLPVKRIWFSDTTTDVLSKALNNLQDENLPRLKNMTLASKLRARFDWLIGMNLSTAYSLAAKSNISTGRVMSPTLKIVDERTKEVANFKPVSFWMVEGLFEGYSSIYTSEETKGRFAIKKEAESFINSLSQKGTVTALISKKVETRAPSLFDLSELQSEASKLFGYSLKKTLTIAQSLYETHKILSYPRTDSQHVTVALANQFNTLLDSVAAIDEYSSLANKIKADTKRLSDITKNKSYVNDTKVTDHYAIIPTKKKPNVDVLSTDEKNIYLLVVKRFLAIFLDPLVVEKSKVTTTIDGKHNFITNGSILVSKGFTSLYGYNPKDQVLPNIKKGDVIDVKEIKLLDRKTTPPKLYTDGTLGDAMKSASKFAKDAISKDILKSSEGIGQPATRGDIIEKLFAKDMIKRKNSFIVSTDYGSSLMNAIGSYDVANVEMTADWESKLRDVESGKMNEAEFTKEMNEYIDRSCKMIESTTISVAGSSSSGGSTVVIGTCPSCGGNVGQSKKYFLCENFKKSCQFIVPFDLWGGKIGVADIKKILAGKETKLLKFNTTKKWEAHLTYDTTENKIKTKFSNSGSTPGGKSEPLFSLKDGTEIFEDKFYYHTKDSSIKIPKLYWGAKITQADVKKLVDGKETGIKKLTFTDKTKKEAAIRYDPKINKIKMVK